MGSFYSHSSSIVEFGSLIGDGCKIWHFAHIREGAIVGNDTSIGKSSYIDVGVSIGRNCKIQNFVSIYDGVVIQDSVFVGPSVTFTNDLMPRAFGQWRLAKTLVGEGASIGANSTILCGIEIGRFAMVGAGSVVTRNVEPFALVVGNPARRIGTVCRCGKRVDFVEENCSH